MIEYRIKAHDPDEEDRLIRAVHADDLCATIWDLQQMLHREMRSSDEVIAGQAFSWNNRLFRILMDTGAQAAMDHYR